jgi:hypothetical protein
MDDRIVEHIEKALESEEAAGLDRVEERLMVGDGGAYGVGVGHDLEKEISGMHVLMNPLTKPRSSSPMAW